MTNEQATRLKANRPSKTAELVAATRALHTRESPDPVFRDELAYAMCGRFWKTVVSSRLLTQLVIRVGLKKVAPIVPIIYTRARFGEDCLDAAANQGLKQYVIIGAGYDTTALRRHDLADRLTIYELDHPATQNMKFKRMSDAGLRKPENTHYVSCDLSQESFLDVLDRSGFKAAERTMFSWFGVTFYLEQEVVRTTLKGIADNCAPGSSVLFDYLATRDAIPAEFLPLRQSCADFVARRGEPWVSDLDPATITDFLAPLGFSEFDNIAPSEIPKRYPESHSQLEIPQIFGLCHAKLPAG